MIFAAGLGTRLKPLTDTMPKAMVRVGGEPLLRRVITRLSDAGFTHIVVNVHHFANQIIDYLHENDNFGLDIRISDESDQLLDTGGGLRKAAPLFSTAAPILIHNVDILSNVDLAGFYALDEKVDCPFCGVPHQLVGAQLLVSWRRTKRYLLFNDQMLLVGWMNIETGETKGPFPLERDAQWTEADFLDDDNHWAPFTINGHRLHSYAFSGIHSFGPRAFPYMVGYPAKFPIMDFYLQHCDHVPFRGVVKRDLRLMDVGKLDTLAEAETFLTELGRGSQGTLRQGS